MERISDLHRPKIMILAVATLLAATATVVVPTADAGAAVVSFLLKPGDVAGIAPGMAQVFRTASAVRNAAGERPAKSEIERYEAEGFVEAAIVRLHDPAEGAAKGLSSVFEFETVAGAKAEMQVELKEELDPRAMRKEGILRFLTLRHVKVPGVPTAVAFAFTSNAAAAKLGLESGIAKGLFIDGSCLVAVGIFRPTSKEVIEPVRSGVQAISERTHEAENVLSSVVGQSGKMEGEGSTCGTGEGDTSGDRVRTAAKS